MGHKPFICCCLGSSTCQGQDPATVLSLHHRDEIHFSWLVGLFVGYSESLNVVPPEAQRYVTIAALQGAVRPSSLSSIRVADIIRTERNK